MNSAQAHSRTGDPAGACFLTALQYAERGWPVFPVKPDKRPLTLHGFNDASLDPDKIRYWWREYPNANVAIATGPARLVVIDIDPRNGGDDGFEELVRRVGRETLYSAPTVLTPSGGKHLYFRSDAPVRSSQSKLARGLDVLAQGKCVIAPCSTRGAAGWLWEADDDEREPPPLPATLRSILEPSNKGVWRQIGPTIRAEGTRRMSLLTIAGDLRRRGFGEDLMLTTLRAINGQHCSPPLPDGELREIARSAGVWEPGLSGNLWLAAWTSKLKARGNAFALAVCLAQVDRRVVSLPLSTIKAQTGLGQSSIADSAIFLEVELKAIRRHKFGPSRATEYELLYPA